jgi:ribosomal protein S18 acetylase RimI-like enzyme
MSSLKERLLSIPRTARLEGLPRHARPVTHQALRDHGLLGHDEWLYLRAPEPCPPADDDLAVRHERTDDGDRLEFVIGDDVAGHAVVSVPHPGIGVVWWLEIAAAHRRRGLGRQLLRAARHHLHRAGADQTIPYVDHADHDRQAAIALHRAEGFAVVDHLYAYRTPQRPRHPRLRGLLRR